MATTGFRILLVFMTNSLFISQVHCAITKRQAATLESVLATKAREIPATQLPLDTVFIQSIDRANHQSKYTINGEDTSTYETNQVDSGRDVIVLTSEEDKLPFKKTKQIFVILQQLIGEPTKYVGTLAFVRNAGPAEKHPVPVDGKNKVIEFRFYDDHVIQGKPLGPLLTGLCSSSMIINCLFNMSALVPPEKFITAPRYLHKDTARAVKEEVEDTPLTSEYEDNWDLFYDLDSAQMAGRGIGDVFSGGLLPTALGGASALLCTALALVGICGHGRGQTDVTVVNESGVPLDPAMIQQMMGRRRKRGTDIGPPEYPGWKTQFIVVTKRATLKVEDDAYFYGFGNCPPSKPSEELLQSSKPEDVALYYRYILRTQCLYHVDNFISRILKEKVISLNTKDKTFEVLSDFPSLTKTKISSIETMAIAGGMELAAFSKTYQDRLKKGKTADTILTPDGKRKISKSISFFGETIFNFLTMAKEKAPMHLISLFKVGFNVVKNAFIKLAQDAQRLEKCAECAEDKEVNLNGRIYTMAMNLYIKHFAVNAADKGADLFKGFETFYKDNEAKFEKFVTVYS